MNRNEPAATFTMICILIIVMGGLLILPNILANQNPHLKNEHGEFPTNLSNDKIMGNMKPCENLTPEESSYYDRWLIQCVEIEPLPTSTPEPTPNPYT